MYLRKTIFIGLVLLPLAYARSQTRIKILRDTVLISSGELRIVNSTKSTGGYLYNSGNAVTLFKPIAQSIDTVWQDNSTLYFSKPGHTGNIALPSSGMPNSGANGLVARVALNTPVARTLAAVSGNIRVTNADGVAGNQTVNTDSNIATLNDVQTFTGKTISANTNSIINISPSSFANSSVAVVTGTSGTAPNWFLSTVNLGGRDTLNLPDAGIGVTQGLVNNGTQTIDGVKTFNDTIKALGGFQTHIVNTNSNWAAWGTDAGTGVTNIARILIGSGSNAGWRRVARGGSTYTLQPNHDYAGGVFGTEAVNIAASGTSNVFASVAINPMSIGAGTGTVTNSATLYIKSATTGAANNYSFWSKSGNVRVDLGSDATGDLLYRSSVSAGALNRLPVGAAGQFLGVSAGVPAWRNIVDVMQPFRTVETTLGTSYTLALADRDKTKLFTSGAAVSVTVPVNSSVSIPLNTEFELVQFGAGELIISAGSGVTIVSPGNKMKAGQQYSTIKIKKTATDSWLLKGDLKL